VHEQDRRTDFFKECNKRVTHQRLLPGEALDRRQLAHGELQRHRIVGFAGARPLRMQRRLRPELELALRHEARGRIAPFGIAHGSMGGGEESRPPAAGLVDHVDGVALPHEILRPSFPSVGCAGEIRSGHRAAMHHHDGMGMGLLGGDADLDIHLAVEIFLAVDISGLAADVEKAVARELQGLIRRLRRADGEHRKCGGARC
jgi:hypothetical protein